MSEIEKYIIRFIEGKKPTYSHLKRYRSNIGSDKFGKITDSDSNGLIGDSIVFVSDRPNYHFLRVSAALKKKGIKTVLLTRWGVSKVQSSFFDHILLYDKIIDLKKLQEVNNCTFYVQSWVGWNFLYLYVKEITHSRVLCNVNDLSNLLLDDPSNFKLLGFSDYEIQADLAHEKQLLETADIVTSPYRLNALEAFGNSVIKRSENEILTFPSYPLKSFFYHNDRVYDSCPHLLYAGMIPYDEKPDRLFGDAKMQKPVKALVKQNLKLTVLNNPQHTMAMSDKAIKKNYNFFFSLMRDYSNFIFKTGQMPWDLNKHVDQFHYGIILYSYPTEFLINKVHYENFLPTKLYTYFEANLPVIIVDRLLAASEIIEKYKLGIVISESQMGSVGEIIQRHKHQYHQYVENVRIFRSKYCMEEMIACPKIGLLKNT